METVVPPPLTTRDKQKSAATWHDHYMTFQEQEAQGEPHYLRDGADTDAFPRRRLKLNSSGTYVRETGEKGLGKKTQGGGTAEEIRGEEEALREDIRKVNYPEPNPRTTQSENLGASFILHSWKLEGRLKRKKIIEERMKDPRERRVMYATSAAARTRSTR